MPKYLSGCTVDVSQLVDQLLPTPAVCGLNPVIGKLLKNIYSLLTLSKIRKQRKRGGELSNFQKNIALVSEVTAVPTCATTTAPCHNQLLLTQVPPRYSSKKKYPMKVSFSDLKLWGPHNKLVIIIDNIY